VRVCPAKCLARIGRRGRLAIGSEHLEGQNGLPGGHDALRHRLAVLVAELFSLGGAGDDGPVPRLTVQVIQTRHVKVDVPALVLGIVDDFGNVCAEPHLQPHIAHGTEQWHYLVNAPLSPQLVRPAAMVIGADGTHAGHLVHVAHEIGQF